MASPVTSRRNRETGLEIAIVGMHCRLPGADSVDAFWSGLKSGFDGTTRLTAAQLDRAGVPRHVYQSPSYVPVCGILKGVDLFDHGFFGVSAPEASLMDPQHRLLMESCFRALESAGYAGPQRERIGVFAGVSPNTYLVNRVLPSRSMEALQNPDLGLLLASDKDFAALRVAYHLGLAGPALAVQTACSTGLSVVHAACRALQAGDCDLAIAAAACIRVPQNAGYLFQEGGIYSRRGQCRAFDADADGCVPGNGVAAVVLRRQADAVEAGDSITAVIVGSAVNNDGDNKLSFAAPSVEGQAGVIRAAHLGADVSPAEIGYVEAHGTATQLGDPIEAEALADVFRGTGPATCGLGSVKTNIGHLDAAAGLAGLIKAALAVRYARLPPSLHFSRLNPHIRLGGSAFFIVSELSAWRTDGARIAGVSSFGVGGTNAHVVLMEPPAPKQRPPSTGTVALALSATRPELLPETARSLAAEFHARPSIHLGDASFTLFHGRRHLPSRAVVLARNMEEAIARLEAFLPAGGPNEEAGQGLEGFDAARLWIKGQSEDMGALIPPASVSRRITLPGAVLSPTRHWVDLSAGQLRAPHNADADRPTPVSVCGALQSWTWVRRPAGPPPAVADSSALWVIVHAGQKLAREMVSRIGSGRKVVEIHAEQSGRDVEREIAALLWPGQSMHFVVACFPDEESSRALGAMEFAEARRLAWSLAFSVARAITRSQQRLRVHIDLLTRGRFDVLGTESLDFGQWLIHGIQEVLPQESSGVTVRSIDLCGNGLDSLEPELNAARPASVAIREGRVWIRELTNLPSLEPAPASERSLAVSGPVLMPGGFGGIGRALALQVARDNPGIGMAIMARDAGATVRSQPWDEAVTRLGAIHAECVSARPVRLIEDSSEVVCELHRLCGARITSYWVGLGLPRMAGTAFLRAELTARSGVLAKFERMLDFQVAYLADSGFVEAAGQTIVWRRDGSTPQEGDQAAARIRVLEPDLASVVDLLETCAGSYPQALSGKREPISILYPQGNERLMGAAAEVMIQRSFGMAACRTLGRWAAEAASGSRGRPFRILEVGAGNGLLTREIAVAVQSLPEGRVELIATDIGRNLVEAGKARAAAEGWRHVEFGVLDISANPASQGYDPASFDLVCGLNVVHATPNVAGTLAGLRSLLAPGGVLAIIESVRREPWVDMVAGLAEGWWSFADERELSPLLCAKDWLRAFRQADLHGTVAFPGTEAGLERADCALIVGAAEASRVVNRDGMTETDLPADCRSHVEALRGLGATVEVVFADLCDASSVQSAVALARERLGPLRALFHCAGRIGGGLIRNLSNWEMEVEFGARVRGVLHALTAMRADPLKDVLLSSSRNVLTGGLGQAAYVSANAVLSGITERLRRSGVRAMTVHWDRWIGVGLGRTFEERYRKLTNTEISGGMTADQALRALELAWLADAWDVVITGPAGEDRAALAARESAGHSEDPLLTGVPASSANLPAEHSPARVLMDFISRHAGTPPLSPTDRLVDAGVDSLLALELQAKLQSTFKVTVFSAALITEPLERITDAILNPDAHPSTVEAADPAAVAKAVRDFAHSIS